MKLVNDADESIELEDRGGLVDVRVSHRGSAVVCTLEVDEALAVKRWLEDWIATRTES